MIKWEATTIGALFNVKSSKRIYASEYMESGVPFYRSREIIEIREKGKTSGEHFISEKRYKELKEKFGVPSKGDILITSVGTVGRVWYVDKEKFYFKDGNLNWIESHNDEVKSKYLYYWLDSEVGRNNIINQTIGTSQSALTIKALKRVKVRITDDKTLGNIVDILSAYDNLIENNNNRIRVLENIASEIYKEWFVRLRFPEYKETEFKNYFPKDWEIKKIGDLINHDIGGGWGKEYKEDKYDQKAYVIRGTDILNIRNGNINYEHLRYHTESNLKNRRLEHGDIIFEASGGSSNQRLGRTLYITEDTLNLYEEEVICASFCKLIRVNDKYLSWFLYNYLNHAYETELISTFEVQSTGISNFGFTNFKKMHSLFVPNYELIKKFYELTYEIQEEIVMLWKINQNLTKQRDMLLPRLMNGTIQVK